MSGFLITARSKDALKKLEDSGFIIKIDEEADLPDGKILAYAEKKKSN